ncbi:ATP-binding protein [Hoeflea ulvae]|uniref:ATP-binding protein n=1 Tax=Hoeflea ulvae TaxID=2983764 RepID=A0ABT3YKY9_9HYPH|nr:ATP-binding protein [Hoeflea ulvae]MCY0096581.1 ATP-binding protein [Hoeflea ulvae]
MPDFVTLDTGSGADSPLINRLAAEWERAFQLLQIAVSHRKDKPVSPDMMNALAQSSIQVDTLRKSGGWKPVENLTGFRAGGNQLLFDLVALAILPTVRPSAVFGLMNLQHPASTDPAPTAAAIYDILALDGRDDADFARALADIDELATRGIMRCDGVGPLRSFHPGALLTTLLSGTDQPVSTPGGVVRMPEGKPLETVILPKQNIPRLLEVLDIARFKDHARKNGEHLGGPLVLLAGGPGTGKSYAASALARELKRPLYRVDFGMVMSKWVGETERNLNRIFDSLSGLGAALLIDEADALLGKRVMVKEGRDQYANATVGHLLARFERHDGAVFLTTNLMENIDDAYFRRFDFVIGFPRPSESARRKIWNNHLPGECTGDDRFALIQMAGTVSLTGGEIANAAAMARAFAHAGNTHVSAAHLAHAVWREVTKTPRTVARRDLAALADFLKAEEDL